MQAEAEDKSAEELSKLNDEVVHCRKCIQNMTKVLIYFCGIEISDKASSTLEEANEAANKSCHGIRGFCKKLNFGPTSSDEGNITGENTPEQAVGYHKGGPGRDEATSMAQ
jgi:hypothetical protein